MTLRERINLIEDIELREEILATVNPKHNSLGCNVDDDCSLVEVIFSSFVWSDTPQGHKYWSDKAKSLTIKNNI